MRLYLVQHGEAEDKSVNPDRPLTAKGRADVECVARFLEAAGVRIGKIEHSGKTRARETAEIYAKALGAADGAKQRDGMSPKDAVAPVKKQLANSSEDVMLVGHLPFMDKLASLLAAGDEDAGVAEFEKGCVLCLAQNDDKAWRVAWMVTPGLARR
jgi:phosphohistidine phosphatase